MKRLVRPAALLALLVSMTPAEPMDGQNQPAPPAAHLVPIFREECDDPRLDERWEFEDGAMDPRPFMKSSRWRANVDVADGVCRIHHRLEDRLGKPWTSGHAWSRQEFRYGYFEARMKFVQSAGINNAFWLMSRRHPGDGKRVTCEIDVVEGGHPSRAHSNLHIATPEGVQEFPSHGRRPSVDADGYSTYAVWWTYEAIRWYWNGELVRTLRNPGCHHPMAVRFSTAVIPEFWGNVDERLDGRWTSFEYLRVFGVMEPATPAP